MPFEGIILFCSLNCDWLLAISIALPTSIQADVKYKPIKYYTVNLSAC